MKKVENILHREKNEVKEVIIQAKSRLKSAPEGHIRIAKKGRIIYERSLNYKYDEKWTSDLSFATITL